MIIGIGIDILEKHRIQNIIKKHKNNFTKKILNKQEIQNYQSTKNKIMNLSKLFSLKEAFVKALGTGFKNKISFKKIIIKNTILGKPTIKNSNFHVYASISHEKNIIIAIAFIKIKN